MILYSSGIMIEGTLSAKYSFLRKKDVPNSMVSLVKGKLSHQKYSIEKRNDASCRSSAFCDLLYRRLSVLAIQPQDK